MTTIPVEWRDDAERLRPQDTFLWGVVLRLHDDETLDLRVAISNQPTTWTAGGITFYPFPMEMDEIAADRDGALPQIRMTLSNRPRMLAPYLESPGAPAGLVGSIARIVLSSTADLSKTWAWEFEVEDVTLSNESATFTLGVPNFLDVLVPQERFVSQCRHHEFGGRACGYVVNAFAGYSSCPRTYAACVLRGLDMLGRGLPQLQPMRFGGFPGAGRA